MSWLSYRWWWTVSWAYWLIGRSEWIDSHWERQGIRRVLGGRWGRWEVVLGGGMGTFKIWWPSPCEHYPPVPFANTAVPLETEEW